MYVYCEVYTVCLLYNEPNNSPCLCVRDVTRRFCVRSNGVSYLLCGAINIGR